jgi:hypothetical protein
MNRPRGRLSVLALTVATAIAFGAFASAGSAVDPKTTFELKLVPKPVVTDGRRVLAAASLSNDGQATLTLTSITFFLPLGSFEFASPDRCSATDRGGFTEVSCNIGKLKKGQSAKQFVAFTAPGAVEKLEVRARAAYKEGLTDNPPASHMDTKFDSDSIRIAASGAQDEFGGCPTEAGTFTTVPASGEGNPQSTTIDFGLSDDLPCTPIAIGEQDRTPENPGCPPKETCTTQVSFVTLPPLPDAATVTLFFDGSLIPEGTTPENFVLWETPDTFPAAPIRRVNPCPLQEGEDSCIVDIDPFGETGIMVVLRVTGLGAGGGVGDPRFSG